MKLEDIKCPWLTRLARLRREQEEDKDFYDSDEYLIDIFSWDSAPEGYEFWNSVYIEEITNKKEALKFLFLEEGIMGQNEDGTYFFINEDETDKIYNE